MVPTEGFAAAGVVVGLSAASGPIAVLAALVITVITLVNRIGRQAGSILDNLSAAGEHTRPLLDLVPGAALRSRTKGDSCEAPSTTRSEGRLLSRPWSTRSTSASSPIPASCPTSAAGTWAG